MNKKKDLTSFLKRCGFINQSSEIYDGLGKSWDLGANGISLKKNLKDLWWEYFIASSEYNVPCETSILTNEKVLEASGHKKNFHDWVVECNSSKRSYQVRVDSLLNEEDFKRFLNNPNDEQFIEELLRKNKCDCGSSFSKPKQFNLMLRTNLSSNPKEERNVYLRPETCQGIFTNFLLIKNSTNKSLPFGIGQTGKSFRNEATLNHGIFRVREFDQAELEFFVKENQKEEWWNYWTANSFSFFNKLFYGNNQERKIEKRNVDQDELPHYALKTLDIYFNYHFGWGEVCSISDRGDYDLKNHSEKSSVFLGLKNEQGEKFFPNVIEVSFGIERMMLAILEDSYNIQRLEDGSEREYLTINPVLAPFFVSVMPLSNQLREISHEIYRGLLKNGRYAVSYEETGGNIGKRYRRQDAIGTFFCVTIDFRTTNDYQVTIRERDSMKQKRVAIKELEEYLESYYKKERRNFISNPR